MENWHWLTSPEQGNYKLDFLQEEKYNRDIPYTLFQSQFSLIFPVYQGNDFFSYWNKQVHYTTTNQKTNINRLSSFWKLSQLIELVNWLHNGYNSMQCRGSYIGYWWGKMSCLARDLFPIYDYQTGPDWVRCRQKSIQLLLSQLNQVT